MAKKPLPTQATLRQLLDYNPKTGLLTWRERTGKWSSRWNKRYAGEIAGCKKSDGYICIKIYDHNLLAHRVIWAWAHNAWPECIDHRDGNPSNNRLRNLRAVSPSINSRNQKKHSSNTSGRTGVSWYAPTQKWLASVKIAGKSIHLGHFSDFNEAVEARRIAENKMGFTGRL